MLRRLTLAVALAGGLALQAGIWPEQFGSATRTSHQPAATSDQTLWDEYGLAEAEQAEYKTPAGTFRATGWRLKDSTSALAVFEWQRPSNATPSKRGHLAAEFPGGAILAFGNYCFRLEGAVPPAAEFQDLIGKLPRLDQSALPTWTSGLPEQNLVANSERYIMGPTSLARFEARISPSLAGFQYSAEGQAAKFHSPAGEIALVLFSYPTPDIARERQAAFRKLPGAMVKRSGPLLGVVIGAPDANEAEKLLAKVRYQASLTWNEYVPSKRDNIGNLIINVFSLIGVLLAFCLVAGLAFGGLRALKRRALGGGAEEESLITLHLNRE
jgi:hypothetical protein